MCMCVLLHPSNALIFIFFPFFLWFQHLFPSIPFHPGQNAIWINVMCAMAIVITNWNWIFNVMFCYSDSVSLVQTIQPPLIYQFFIISYFTPSQSADESHITNCYTCKPSEKLTNEQTNVMIVNNFEERNVMQWRQLGTSVAPQHAERAMHWLQLEW